MDKYDFYTGNSFDAYEFMGAHIVNGGVMFRTYAPNAAAVSVIGEFNGWEEQPMERIDNFYELFVPGAREGMMYKYRIHEGSGRVIDHCDPYGFGMELRPNTASIIRDLNAYKFGDQKWMKSRTNRMNEPLNIYELHAGSWRRKENGDFYSYTELGELLIPYLLENGYNYIEFLPLAEHPCDESWGYQVTGFFSPTSRYGTAAELMELVDMLHRNNIGVIMDYVPVHFAVDDYGLAYYDGTALYEYPSTDVGYSEWGSHNFMHSRGEVRSFLRSAANYWLGEYHFDGLRMDAIRNLIYWNGDEARGVNDGGVRFLQSMNDGLRSRHKGVMLIAEDSTAYKGVTAPTSEGGLGFDYKWDMGFMHDTFSYFQSDTEERAAAYNRLTFSMMYFYDEKYILPFSHDEVVHGKASVIQKMNGDYDKKFPQARALYMYMYAHPGKKMNFMGNELGQFREWDESREQDWCLLDYPIHRGFARFMRDICLVYMNHPALYAKDYPRGGFRWLICKDDGSCVYAFERMGGGERIAAVFNLSDEPRTAELDLKARALRLIIATENTVYGGGTEYETDAELLPDGGAFRIEMPPQSGCLYEVLAQDKSAKT